MLKEAIEFLLKLKRPETIVVDDKQYSTIEIKPVKDSECMPISVYNLDSLIKYLKENPDKEILKDTKKIINVNSPWNVEVLSCLFGKFKQRESYISADCNELIPYISFEKYLSIEEFIIMLKSKFVMTEDLEKIIKVVGNITDENVTNYNDDGITQKVITRTGIARVGEVALPPKVKLKPFRTFVEVEQPESEFLLRLRKSHDEIEIALFEADGGAWKKEAIKNIERYLIENLTDVENITIL